MRGLCHPARSSLSSIRWLEVVVAGLGGEGRQARHAAVAVVVEVATLRPFALLHPALNRFHCLCLLVLVALVALA